DEEPADEATADDEHAPARHELERAEDARERLDVGAVCVVDGRRHFDAVRECDALGEPAGNDRRLGEPFARGLVTGAAAGALATGPVVDERKPPSVDPR